MRSTSRKTARKPTSRSGPPATTSSCWTSPFPGCTGSTVLRRMRDRRSRVPVLILTARDTPEDRVEGLDLGADDYMTKPFDLPEFEARVRALLRRANLNDGGNVNHGSLRFDAAARRLFYADQPIDVSVRELAVIELLLVRQGRVVEQGADDRPPVRLGRRRRAATRSRSTSTACAGSSSPSASKSAPCAAWATSSTRSMTPYKGTLRGKLLRWLLIPLSGLFLADAAGSYFIATSLSGRVYDGELMEVARELALHVRREGVGLRFDLERGAERTLLLDQYDKVYYTVRSAAGARGGRGRGLWRRPTRRRLARPPSTTACCMAGRSRVAVLLDRPGRSCRRSARGDPGRRDARQAPRPGARNLQRRRPAAAARSS